MKWHNEQIYRLIKNYTKPYRCRFVILMIAMLMKVLIDMSFSIMYGLIVDEIIYYRNMEAFFQLVFVTFILVFAYIFSSIIETGAFWNTQLRFVLDLRVGIMKSIYHAKARFLDHMKSGDVLRSVNLDTPEYMNVITDNIFETISTAAALLVTIVVSFSIDKYLAVAMMIQIPLSSYLTLKLGNTAKKSSASLRARQGELNSWILEIVRGARDIRFLNAQNNVLNLFSQYYGEILIHLKKLMQVNNYVQCIGKMIVLVSDLCFYAVGAYLVYHNLISIGAFISMVSLAVFSQKQLTKLCEFYILLKSRQISLTNVADYINLEQENNSGKEKFICTKGEIVIKHLAFGYTSDRDVFKDFNFCIHPGEQIAVVGKSGSGKSTFVKLLIQMYEPNQGEIWIDGQNIMNCSYKSVRKQIGYVQQDVFLFEGTIRYNLTLGDSSYHDAEIMRACEYACIDQLIDSLPDGLNTILAPNEVQLSGGQKQRLAIARVVLRNPAIVIFDEVTSALDSDTEELIHRAWQKISKNKTSIIVTHRLASAMQADRVLVLNHGCIEACGTPEQLYQSNKLFQDLFQL